MAAADALDAEPGTAQGSVFLYRLKRVLRAGRCEPAGRRSERRDAALIEAYQEDEE